MSKQPEFPTQEEACEIIREWPDDFIGVTQHDRSCPLTAVLAALGAPAPSILSDTWRWDFDDDVEYWMELPQWARDFVSQIDAYDPNWDEVNEREYDEYHSPDPEQDVPKEHALGVLGCRDDA